MKICVVTSLYPSPERAFEGIFAERRWLGMHARGHTVRVVQPLPWAPPFAPGHYGLLGRRPRRETRSGIPVSRPRYLHLPGRDLWNVARFSGAAWREIGRLQRSGFEPEIVVCDYAWPAAGIAPRLQAAGLPCVINGRGSDVLEVAGEAGFGQELAAFLSAAGHWCAVSRDLVDAMDRLAAAPGRGFLVPNGVDLERFRPSDRRTARHELGLGDEPLVLVVGHLIARKDPGLALQAFASGAASNARLVFLGRGPLEEELRAQARERGLAERVSFVGEVAPEKLATWYAAGDLLLLTSRREGRPNVVLEALASGRPVLATEAGGTSELLAGGDERMLASDRDVELLAQRLASLLESPPPVDKLRALAEPLSWERSFEALEACLSQAVRDAR